MELCETKQILAKINFKLTGSPSFGEMLSLAGLSGARQVTQVRRMEKNGGAGQKFVTAGVPTSSQKRQKNKKNGNAVPCPQY